MTWWRSITDQLRVSHRELENTPPAGNLKIRELDSRLCLRRSSILEEKYSSILGFKLHLNLVHTENMPGTTGKTFRYEMKCTETYVHN